MSTENQNGIVKKTITNISETVLQRINTFKSSGDIKLPANYSPENALKSAWLVLQETFDRNKKPVLESCTQASIANALLDMVISGLSVAKKQCYFVAYGQKLTMMRSYQGTELLAKRLANVKEINANAIYEGDEFEYEVDAATGRKKVSKHVQKLENIDHEKVKGAYAIITFNDGTVDCEIMNIKQIRKAWAQGAANGNSGAHNNFTDEMACKTVINRACKTLINSSDDAELYQNEDGQEDAVSKEVKAEIKSNANTQQIGIDESITTIEIRNEETAAEVSEVTESESETESAPY